MEEDIRWEQRFSNYKKAFLKLEQAVDYINETVNDTEEDDAWPVMDEMRKEALIQRFEYTHELAWNVMKDYVENEGSPNVGASKGATREGFRLELIKDGQVWMDMITSRNETSHTYNEQTVNEIFVQIMKAYYPAFLEFRNTMEEKISGSQKELF